MQINKGVRVILAAVALLLWCGKGALASEAKMTLDRAMPMIQAAEAKAKEIGVPMVIAVVDGGGNLIAQHRMDDALLVSVEISLNKAYSAVALKMSTAKMGELSQPGAMLYGLQNVDRMIIFGGGIPIKSGDKIIGAIGVSGGSVAEDTQCAEAGMAALKLN